MVPVLLGLAAALGTLAGLFLGMPAAGFVLWPLTQAVCRLREIEVDPTDDRDPVMRIEGSIAAGLGMALGVAGSVLVVGLVLQAPRVLLTAAAASGTAGLIFGSLWSLGYARRSASPLVLSTAVLAGLAAGLTA